MSDYSKYVGTQTIQDVENYYIGQTPSPLITVKTTDTVEAVIKVLRENNILSVPVVDEKQTTASNGTPYVSVVSATDLLTAFAFQPVFNSYDTDSKLSELKEDTLSQVAAEQKKVLSTQVGNYAGLSLEGKRVWAFKEKDPVSKLLDAFSVGIHRVLVSHETRSTPYWTFVSQTDVLRYLKVQSYSRNSKIHEIFLNSLSSLKLGQASSDKKLFTLHEKTSAISGFRQMLERNELSALPVVNEEGKLVETLSASDFRHISLDNIKDSLHSTGAFLAKRRGQFKQVLVTAVANEPLYSAVDKLLLTGVHRVWVVNGAGKPTGVVSLTDIIKTFSSYAPSIE